jgi:hypothetical protein
VQLAEYQVKKHRNYVEVHKEVALLTFTYGKEVLTSGNE